MKKLETVASLLAILICLGWLYVIYDINRMKEKLHDDLNSLSKDLEGVRSNLDSADVSFDRMDRTLDTMLYNAKDMEQDAKNYMMRGGKGFNE